MRVRASALLFSFFYASNYLTDLSIVIKLKSMEKIERKFDGITVEVEVIKRYGSVVIGLCQDRICAFNELDETARPMCLADCLDAVAELSSDYEG